MTKRDAVFVYNMYGASFGFRFKRYPQLNSFYYGAGRAQLPPSCIGLVERHASMGKADRALLLARTTVLKLGKSHAKK